MVQLGVATIFAFLLHCVAGEFIYIGAGSNGTDLRSVSMYNGTSWTALDPVPTATSNTLFIVFQGNLCHLAGGRNGLEVANLECWNGGSWFQLTAMPVARFSGRAAVTANGQKLCYSGGILGTTFYSNVNCFNGSVWSPAPSMSTPRSGHGLLNFRGSICAVAGISAAGAYLSSWECLTPTGTFWTIQGSNLTTPRYNFGSAWFPDALSGFGTICVAGGYAPTPAGGDVSALVECVNAGIVWEPKSPLGTQRALTPMVYYGGLGCMTGGVSSLSNLHVPVMECFNYSANAWSTAPGLISPQRWSHGAAVYSPPTQAPTQAPTFAPTTAPTISPTTANPTTSSPTSASPTTAQPTLSPATSSPTKTPTTQQPSSAPTHAGCGALLPVANGKGNCDPTPHMGNCTQNCSYGVATGDQLRRCIDGVWGDLVCNSESNFTASGASAGPTTNIFGFASDNWVPIIIIVAICVGGVIIIFCIGCFCVRHRRKKEAETGSAIAMTTVPPYTEQGDFVFPDADPPAHEDPFETNKRHIDPNDHAVSQAAAQDTVLAAEKVRQDQEAALEQIQKSRASRADEDGKHEGSPDGGNSPGYGGISRKTVT